MRCQVSPLLAIFVICIFRTPTNAQWTQLAEYDPASHSQPAKRCAHSLVIYQDTLYVFGGVGDMNDEDNHEYDDTWKYEIAAGRWVNIIQDRQGSPSGNLLVSPHQRSAHATAVHVNGSVSEMIIFGGISVSQKIAVKGVSMDTTVTHFNDIWRLTLHPAGHETWSVDNPTNGKLAAINETLASLVSAIANSTAGLSAAAPVPRSEAGAVAHDGQLYIFGGIAYDITPPVNFGDLWRYDLSSCSWMKIAMGDGAAPSARFSHTFSKFTTGKGETFLVVFSGRHLEPPSWSMLGDVWLFSLTTHRWTELQMTTPIRRAYTSVITISGATPMLWYFGGYYRASNSATGYVVDDMEAGVMQPDSAMITFFPPALNQVDKIPPRRYNHRVVLWRGTMIVHGGSYQSQLGDLWSFNLTNPNFGQESAAIPRLKIGALGWIVVGIVFSLFLALVVVVVRWCSVVRSEVGARREISSPIMVADVEIGRGGCSFASHRSCLIVTM